MTRDVKLNELSDRCLHRFVQPVWLSLRTEGPNDKGIRTNTSGENDLRSFKDYVRGAGLSRG